MRIFRIPVVLLSLILLTACSYPTTHVTDVEKSKTQTQSIGIIGDFGSGNESERLVAELIERENPQVVATVGDNVYSDSGYDKLVGTYYRKFLNNKAFYPATGNHDYELGIEKFDTYFGKTPQTRYYTFSVSNIDFFVLDSEQMLQSEESLNTQRTWLTNSAANSSAKFKIVILHHPPYSSSSHHGSTTEMQWDYSALGINMVISGHDHTYERFSKADVTYVVDGTGGKTLYECGNQLPESIICLDQDFGALFLEASESSLSGEFMNVAGKSLDKFQIKAVTK